MNTIVVPIALGIAFGWALRRSGMTQYRRVADVFLFRDLTLIKFLFTALVVGAVGVEIFTAVGISTRSMPISATYVLGNAIGGALLGVGMALSGYCPATVVAGAAEGRLDYAVPGLAGMLAGAWLFGMLYPRFFAAIARLAVLGHTTVPRMLDVRAVWCVALLVEVVALLFYAIERRRAPRH